MYPILFYVAGRPVHAYGTLLMIGFTFGYFMARWAFQHRGLKMRHLLPMFSLAFVTAIFGSHLLEGLVRLVNGDGYLGGAISSGMTEIGGMALACTSVLLYLRWQGESPWSYIDGFTLGTIQGLGFGRIGCFLAGCCHGRPTDVPWAVTFTDPHSLAQGVLGVPVHPAQLYMVAGMWGLFAILLVLFHRNEKPGRVLVGLLTGYPLIRFVQETFRADPDRGAWFGGTLTTYQLICLVLFLVMLPVALWPLRATSGQSDSTLR